MDWFSMLFTAINRIVPTVSFHQFRATEISKQALGQLQTRTDQTEWGALLQLEGACKNLKRKWQQ